MPKGKTKKTYIYSFDANKPLNNNQFATLTGVTRAAVGQAIDAGILETDSSGLIVPIIYKNAAFIRRKYINAKRLIRSTPEQRDRDMLILQALNTGEPLPPVLEVYDPSKMIDEIVYIISYYDEDENQVELCNYSIYKEDYSTELTPLIEGLTFGFTKKYLSAVFINGRGVGDLFMTVL